MLEDKQTMIHVSDCYYCICTACSCRKCLKGRKLEEICYKSCWSEGRKFPRLDCDYFTMAKRSQIFHIKNKPKPSRSSLNAGEMLLIILDKLGCSIDKTTELGGYNVYYNDFIIKENVSFAEAKKICDSVGNTEAVRIEKK